MPSYDEWNTKQLRRELRERGIDTKGEGGRNLRRAELVERLQRADEADAPVAEQAAATPAEQTEAATAAEPTDSPAEQTEALEPERQDDDALARSAKAGPSRGPRQFRVLRTSRYCVDGAVHRIAKGSVVTNLTHDVAGLREQGVPLEPCERYELPRDAYGAAVLPLEREVPPTPPAGPTPQTPEQPLAGHPEGATEVPSPDGGTELEPPEAEEPKPSPQAEIDEV